MDWKGLLNWSIKYQDGTVDKSLKPMSKENMKFIEDAFESVCVNEMKLIMKILDKLKVPENDDEEDVESRLESIEDLLLLVDGPENGRNLVRAKRFREITDYFFSTKHKKIKLLLCTLLGSVMQNDKFIQAAALDFGIFKILELIDTSKDQTETDKYIYLLTGVLFGEFEKTKRIFLEDLDGMKLIYNLLIKTDPIKNESTFKRLTCIIKELTKIEEEDAENYKIRFIALEKIKEIELQCLLLKIMKEFEYTKDNIDIIRNLLLILQNTVKLYDSLEDVFKLIGDLNNKLNLLNGLDKEEMKQEKAFLIELLRNLKLEYTKKNESNENNNFTGVPSTDNQICIMSEETEKKGMHIQLK